MPSGVGARVRSARIVFTAVLATVGFVALAPAAHAQQAPQIVIMKQTDQGDVTAFFSISGPQFSSSAQATTVNGGPTAAVADPPLSGLVAGAYTITENGTNGAYQLTDIACDGGAPAVDLGAQQVTINLEEDAPTIICTFTDTLAGATILGRKIVTGDTSTWVRPAQFHISCPDLQLDDDIEPPIGPGGPGTYIIGQGAIPPATCTISEVDTGSNGPVSVSMSMTNHGVPIAFGGSSITFTSHVGDDLVLTATNVFQGLARPEPPEQATTTTGGSTTTSTSTTIATTTTATTVPNGGGSSTSVPVGGGSTSVAATSVPNELPTTGSPTGGLLVAGLIAMFAGVALVARTRRFVD